MEVESTGATASDASKNKILFVILGVLGVAIVGLTIAIIVVKSMPKGDKDDERGPVNVAYDNYENVRQEIVDAVADSDSDDTEIIELYQTNINEAKDEQTKAYLMKDYYEEIMAQDIEMVKGNEVIDGLVGVDKILNDATSAMAVWSAAEYYGITDIANKYKSISEERLGGGIKLEYVE